MTSAHELGRQIAAKRTELEMTQEQLALAAGVSEKTVYNVEAGKNIRPGTARSIQRALGLVSPDDEAQGDLRNIRVSAGALVKVSSRDALADVLTGVIEDAGRPTLEDIVAGLSLLIAQGRLSLAAHPDEGRISEGYDQPGGDSPA